MATTKSSKKKKSQPAKRKNTRNNKQTQSQSFTSEIILLIALAVAILLILSNVGVGGYVGNSVSDFFFGVFGIMTYLFPFLLFIAVAFLLSNSRNPLAYKKIISGVFLYVFLCSLTQLLMEGYLRSSAIADFYRISSRYHTGGGVIGGGLDKLLVMAFGIYGTYILLIVGVIITLILITQRSFFGFFKKIFDGIRNSSVRRQSAKPERPEKEEKESKPEHTRQEQAAGIEEPLPETEGEVFGESEEEEYFKDDTDLFDRFEQKETLDKKPEKKSNAFSAFSLPHEVEIEREDSEANLVYDEEEQEEVIPDAEPTEPIHTPKRESSRRASRSSKAELETGVSDIKKEINAATVRKKAYHLPPMRLLKKGSRGVKGESDAQLRDTAMKLQETLHNFGVEVTVTNISCGPTVTRYELQPEQGVKVSKIVSLTDDIKLNLATPDIRIEAPIPGKAAVGIEVPNKENRTVMLGDLIQSSEFKNAKSKLSFAVGKDIGGHTVVADIARMPHLLIAGATGSGKSVCINDLIISILYKAAPEEVRLIMVDPKVVELSVYNGIPHLLIPVVTDPKKAAGALNWAVAEMTDRYNTFAEYNVRNIEDYNRKLEDPTLSAQEEPPQPMPQIVIIVDELADLMMVAPSEVEDAICRLAQLARAAGIHLVVATQRPSVNVITGLIKANMPSRIAFSVSSGVDSRTILDMNGAEKLLGKGDMLFYPQGYQKPARIQGAYVSDEEISAVVAYLSSKNPTEPYNDEIASKIEQADCIGAGTSPADERDTYFVDAGKFIIEKEKASIGMLQRMFKIGFNRAARIMDQLAAAGVVGPEEGTKPRKILMTMDEFEEYIKTLS